MTAEQLWNKYITLYPDEKDKEFEAWCFGSDSPDTLARLTLDGIKTATASAYPEYVFENSALPEVGSLSVVLFEDESAACIIKTIRVSIIPFSEVSALHAYKEGEGDRSLEYWRNAHKHFFTLELKEIGQEFNESMPVVCEEYEVVLKASD